jgi:hypothetical protein
MSVFKSLVTAAVFIPFTLLTLYYFHSIAQQTLQDSEDLTSWQDRLYFAGLVLFQVIGFVVFGILVYLVLEVKLGF